MTDSQESIAKLDTGVAHTARTWNYWLGGKDAASDGSPASRRCRA